LAKLGHTISDQTVGNILRRHGIAPAPKRSQTTTWRDFIAAHMDVLAGTDFFRVEVLTWRGLVTYYLLFFIHLDSRRVTVAGVTQHADQEWMEQVAPKATHESWGYLNQCRYVLHDSDTKFCSSFRSVLAAGRVKTIRLPAKSPELCLNSDRIITVNNHQGKGNNLLFRSTGDESGNAAIVFNVTSGSAVSSNTTGVPHEYFLRTGSPRPVESCLSGHRVTLCSRSRFIAAMMRTSTCTNPRSCPFGLLNKCSDKKRYTENP
jgi:hypothetical protein